MKLQLTIGKTQQVTIDTVANIFGVIDGVRGLDDNTDWDFKTSGARSIGNIGKIILAVVIIVALGIAAAFTGGALTIILTGAFWGALSGALIGRVMGGSYQYDKRWLLPRRVCRCALSGAVTGAIAGAACAGIIGLSGNKAPAGYTWHHMEDGTGMLLVEKTVHSTKFGFPHTGGFSLK